MDVPEYKPTTIYEVPTESAMKLQKDKFNSSLSAKEIQKLLLSSDQFRFNSFWTALYYGAPVFGGPELPDKEFSKKIDSIPPLVTIDFQTDELFQFKFFPDSNFSNFDWYTNLNPRFNSNPTNDFVSSSDVRISEALKWHSLLFFILSFTLEKYKDCSKIIPGELGYRDSFFTERGHNILIDTKTKENESVLITRKPSNITKIDYSSGDHLKRGNNWLAVYQTTQLQRLLKINWFKRTISIVKRENTQDKVSDIFFPNTQDKPSSIFNLKHLYNIKPLYLLDYIYDSFSENVFTYFELMFYTLIHTTDVLVTQNVSNDKRFRNNKESDYPLDIDYPHQYEGSWEHVIMIMLRDSELSNDNDCAALLDLWNTSKSAIMQMFNQFSSFVLPKGYSFNSKRGLLLDNQEFYLDRDPLISDKFKKSSLENKLLYILMNLFGKTVAKTIYNIFIFIQNSKLKKFSAINFLLLEILSQ